MEDRVDRDNDNRGSRPVSRAWVYFTGIALVMALVAPMVIMVLGDYAPAEIVDQQSQQLNKLDQRATDLANIVEAMKGGDVKELQQVVLALSEQVQELQRQLQQVDTSKVKEQIESALNLGPWRELQVLAEAGKKHLERADSELKTWSDKTVHLNESDAGKRVSSSQDAVKQYMALARNAEKEGARVGELTQRFRALSGPVTAAVELGYMDAPPKDGVVAEIQAIHDEAIALVEAFETRNAALEKLLREVPASVSDNASTLETTVKRLIAEEAESRAAEIERRVAEEKKQIDEELIQALAAGEKQVADAKKESQDRINEEEIEWAGKIGEAKVQELRQSAEKLAEDMKLRAEEHARQLAKTRLEAELDQEWPTVERVLRPFLAEMTEQPGGLGPYYADSAMPMSLSDLHTVVTADDDGHSLYLFMMPLQKRRTLGFPSYSNPGDMQRVRQAREFLKKYGDLLVERGLLRK